MSDFAYSTGTTFLPQELTLPLRRPERMVRDTRRGDGVSHCTGVPGRDIMRYPLEVRVTDVLIRDVPDAVLAAVDAHALRLGLSRVEYIRRRLAADAQTSDAAVSADDLERFGRTFADLNDDEVMDQAWR